MPRNPFIFGRPITNLHHFVGRQNEIRQITNRLLSSAVESTSIIGERRMGKTSILLYLANPKNAAGLGFTTDKYCVVYMDLEGAVDLTPQRFWQRVIRLTEKSIKNVTILAAIDRLLRKSSFDIFDLEDLFEIFKEEELNLILLLDEFESITNNRNFGPDFFGGLRSIAIVKPLALVTATQCDLEGLCHSEEIKNSPFFNIFSTVVVRLFDQQDVIQLVETYLQSDSIQFTETEKEWIYDIGGRYPFFIQMAGYYLFEGKSSGLEGKPLYNHLIQNFDQQAEPHFKYLWNQCTESQKITLLTFLILNQKRAPQTEYITLEKIVEIYPRAKGEMEALIRRGMLIETGSHYCLLSPRLAAWILQEIQAIPSEKEDTANLEEWVRKKEITVSKEFLAKFKRKYWPLISTCTQELAFGVAGNALFNLLLKIT